MSRYKTSFVDKAFLKINHDQSAPCLEDRKIRLTDIEHHRGVGLLLSAMGKERPSSS